MTKIAIDYYPEHWDRSMWEDDVRAMAELGTYAVRVGEFAWSRMEPSEGVYDFAWLDDAIDLIAKYGMKVILGTPTNCAPLWLYTAHPDTIQYERDGQPTHLGIRGHRCQTSPTFRAYAEKIIRKMAERYAGRPEILAWQIDNEVESNHCTCPSCRKSFQEWCREKHGTLEQLNRDWGTVVWSGEYSDWSQIECFNTAWVNKSDWFNPAYMLDYERFCSKTTADYVAFQTALIREYDPAAVVTTNACFGLHVQDFYQEFAPLDVASYDNYPPLELPADPTAEVYSNAFALDMVRGWKNKNFWIMEQLGGPMGCWMPTTRAMEPGMLEGYAMQAVAHGADLLSFFRWRTASTGAEMYCYGLLDHDNKPNRRLKELELLQGRLAKAEGLDGTTVKSQVALVFSPDQSYNFSNQTASRGFDYWRQERLFHDALMSLGVNVDVVSDDASLDPEQCKIVIVPAYAVTSDAFAAKLEAYVAAGGHAVLTVHSGTKDVNGNCTVGEYLPGKFARMAGCRVVESDAIGEAVQTVRDANGNVHNISVWCDLLELDGAQAIAEYDERYYAGMPAACRNAYGAGTCSYVGTVGDKSFHRALLVSELRLAGIDFIENLPAGVESCTRSAEGREFRFFFNNTMKGHTFFYQGNRVSLQPLEVKVSSSDGIWL
jgi:beta-galactosidase